MSSLYGVGSSFTFTMQVFNVVNDHSRQSVTAQSHSKGTLTKRNAHLLSEAIAMLSDSNDSDRSLTC